MLVFGYCCAVRPFRDAKSNLVFFVQELGTLTTSVLLLLIGNDVARQSSASALVLAMSFVIVGIMGIELAFLGRVLCIAVCRRLQGQAASRDGGAANNQRSEVSTSVHSSKVFSLRMETNISREDE